jgi:hypothetical protein
LEDALLKYKDEDGDATMNIILGELAFEANVVYYKYFLIKGAFSGYLLNLDESEDY